MCDVEGGRKFVGRGWRGGYIPSQAPALELPNNGAVARNSQRRAVQG